MDVVVGDGGPVGIPELPATRATTPRILDFPVVGVVVADLVVGQRDVARSGRSVSTEPVLAILGEAVVLHHVVGSHHHPGAGVALDRVVLDGPVRSGVVIDDSFVVVPPGLPEVLDRQVLDGHVVRLLRERCSRSGSDRR